LKKRKIHAGIFPYLCISSKLVNIIGINSTCVYLYLLELAPTIYILQTTNEVLNQNSKVPTVDHSCRNILQFRLDIIDLHIIAFSQS